MKPPHDFGGGRFWDPQALRAARHAAIAAHFDDGAHAPPIIPPGAPWGWPQARALFFRGLRPRSVRGLVPFAMDFMGGAREPQIMAVRLGAGDFGDLFAGEVGRESPVPELLFAFDFAFGLGRWGLQEAAVIELERPHQLGQRVRIMREEHTVIIHVDWERPSVGQESGGQESEVGEQLFPFIKLGAGEQTAAIIEPVAPGEGTLGVRKPGVGRGVELPACADLIALPAAHGGADFGGGTAWASWLASAQRRTWARSSLQACRRRASAAAKLYGHGGAQASRLMSRSVTASGHAAA